MLTLKTFSPLTGSYPTALSRRSSNSNERIKQAGSAAYTAPIAAFLQSASIGSILYTIFSTHQFPLPHLLILTFVFHKLCSKNPTPVLRFSKWTRPGQSKFPYL